jgi:cyanate permease
MRKSKILGKKPERSWIMLGCAWLLSFAMFTPIFCIPPIEHIIKRELAVSHAQMGLLFSIPVTVLAAIAIPSGYMADKLGTQKAVGIGAIIMAVGSLMRGTSTSFGILLAFSLLYGIGFSFIYPNLPKLVSTWFSREKAGLATGIYSTGMSAGAGIALAITLPLIFPITNTIQGTFYIWSIPAIIAAILWWIVAKEPPLANIQIQPFGSLPTKGQSLLSLPAAGRGRPERAFVPDKKSRAWVQSKGQRTNRVNEPSYHVWKNKDIWLIALMLFLNNIHFYTWSGWSPALMIMKGAPPDLAALIASVRGWVSLPIIFLMPWISFKVGLRKPFIWGSTLVLAFASLSAIYVPLPLGWLLMVIVGISTGGTFPMILALPVEIMPKESIGMASGMILSIGYLGGLIGPWLAGHIVDATGTLDIALVVLIGIAMIWTYIALLIPETGRRDRFQK